MAIHIHKGTCKALSDQAWIRYQCLKFLKKLFLIVVFLKEGISTAGKQMGIIRNKQYDSSLRWLESCF